MRNPKTRLAIAVVAAGVGATAFVAASPAGANSAGGGVLVGAGGISPGLSSTPTFQDLTFSGQLLAADANGTSTDHGSRVYDCSFSGWSSVAETIAQGAGSLSGYCYGSYGSGGTTSASLTYTRVGSDVVLTGTAVGGISGSIAGDCGFEPTWAPPQIRTYQLQCALTIH